MLLLPGLLVCVVEELHLSNAMSPQTFRWWKRQVSLLAVQPSDPELP